MELDITRYDLDVVEQIADQEPSRIKEKETSLERTKKAVELMVVSKPIEANYEEEKEPVTEVENSVVEENNIEPEIQESTKQYDLVDKIERNILEGKEKAINVKELMLNNIKKMNNIEIEEEKEVATDVEEPVVENEVTEDVSKEIEEDINISEPVTEVAVEEPEIEIKEEKVVEKPKKKVKEETVEKVMEAARPKVQPIRGRKSTTGTDVDKVFAELNEAKDEVAGIMEKASAAKLEADNTEKTLQEIGAHFDEVEKTFQEAENRQREIEQKLIMALNNQKNLLNQEKKKAENSINEANKRREKTESRIIDFQSRINSTIEQTNSVNEKISHQEEILNALNSFADFGGFNEAVIEEAEQSVRKAA